MRGLAVACALLKQELPYAKGISLGMNGGDEVNANVSRHAFPKD